MKTAKQIEREMAVEVSNDSWIANPTGVEQAVLRQVPIAEWVELTRAAINESDHYPVSTNLTRSINVLRSKLDRLGYKDVP